MTALEIPQSDFESVGTRPDTLKIHFNDLACGPKRLVGICSNSAAAGFQKINISPGALLSQPELWFVQISARETTMFRFRFLRCAHAAAATAAEPVKCFRLEAKQKVDSATFLTPACWPATRGVVAGMYLKKKGFLLSPLKQAGPFFF